MKFNKIRLAGFTPIDLPVEGVQPADTYIFKGADGLGPTDVDNALRNTLFAGGFYQGRFPQLRVINIRIGLNPDYSQGKTSESLREEIYGLLTPNPDDYVDVILYKNTTVVAYTRAYIKRVEPVIFSKDPQVQITLECDSAYFEGLEISSSLTPGNFSVVNGGSASTGFSMSIQFKQDVSSFTLTQMQPNGAASSRKMVISEPFANGDYLEIKTGFKSKTLIKRSQAVPLGATLLGKLSADSTFLQLYRGSNAFQPSTSAFDWLYFKHTPRFWGI